MDEVTLPPAKLTSSGSFSKRSTSRRGSRLQIVSGEEQQMALDGLATAAVLPGAAPAAAAAPPTFAATAPRVGEEEVVPPARSAPSSGTLVRRVLSKGRGELSAMVAGAHGDVAPMQPPAAPLTAAAVLTAVAAAAARRPSQSCSELEVVQEDGPHGTGCPAPAPAPPARKGATRSASRLGLSSGKSSFESAASLAAGAGSGSLAAGGAAAPTSGSSVSGSVDATARVNGNGDGGAEDLNDGVESLEQAWKVLAAKRKPGRRASRLAITTAADDELGGTAGQRTSGMMASTEQALAQAHPELAAVASTATAGVAAKVVLTRSTSSRRSSTTSGNGDPCISAVMDGDWVEGTKPPSQLSPTSARAPPSRSSSRLNVSINAAGELVEAVAAVPVPDSPGSPGGRRGVQRSASFAVSRRASSVSDVGGAAHPALSRSTSFSNKSVHSIATSISSTSLGLAALTQAAGAAPAAAGDEVVGTLPPGMLPSRRAPVQRRASRLSVGVSSSSHSNVELDAVVPESHTGFAAHGLVKRGASSSSVVSTGGGMNSVAAAAAAHVVKRGASTSSVGSTGGGDRASGPVQLAPRAPRAVAAELPDSGSGVIRRASNGEEVGGMDGKALVPGKALSPRRAPSRRTSRLAITTAPADEVVGGGTERRPSGVMLGADQGLARTSLPVAGTDPGVPPPLARSNSSAMRRRASILAGEYAEGITRPELAAAVGELPDMPVASSFRRGSTGAQVAATAAAAALTDESFVEVTKPPSQLSAAPVRRGPSKSSSRLSMTVSQAEVMLEELAPLQGSESGAAPMISRSNSSAMRRRASILAGEYAEGLARLESAAGSLGAATPVALNQRRGISGAQLAAAGAAGAAAMFADESYVDDTKPPSQLSAVPARRGPTRSSSRLSMVIAQTDVRLEEVAPLQGTQSAPNSRSNSSSMRRRASILAGEYAEGLARLEGAVGGFGAAMPVASNQRRGSSGAQVAAAAAAGVLADESNVEITKPPTQLPARRGPTKSSSRLSMVIAQTDVMLEEVAPLQASEAAASTLVARSDSSAMRRRASILAGEHAEEMAAALAAAAGHSFMPPSPPVSPLARTDSASMRRRASILAAEQADPDMAVPRLYGPVSGGVHDSAKSATAKARRASLVSVGAGAGAGEAWAVHLWEALTKGTVLSAAPCPAVAACGEQLDGMCKAPWTVHVAPEVLRGQPHGPAADVFALGLLIYELLSRTPVAQLALGGATPSSGAALQAAERLAGGWRPGRADGAFVVPPAVMEVVERCWQRDPSVRPDVMQVAQQLRELLVAAKTSATPAAAGAAAAAAASVIPVEAEPVQAVAVKEAAHKAGEKTAITVVANGATRGQKAAPELSKVPGIACGCVIC